MRIVYLHQYFVTPEMAGGTRSYEMASRMVKAGHEVHVVTSDQTASRKSSAWRTTNIAGINVHWKPVPYNNHMGFVQRVRAFVSFAWHAARKAKALSGDIVFATSTPLTIALPGVYAARGSSAPMVFEIRDLWPAVPIAIGAIKNAVLIRAVTGLERFAYRNAAHVIALAPGMRDHVIATGYPSNQVTVIPNGCDLALFDKQDDDTDVRAKNPWLGSRPFIVFTGTFGRVNGMDYLPRLAKALEDAGSDALIVAFGDGAEFEATRALAEQLGVLDRNLRLMGQKPKHEVADWVSAATMTIALFTGPEIVWRDAVQNKFFDSLAAGTPVASNFAGFQSIVASDAGAGLIVPADNINAAAQMLLDAMSDRDWMNNAKRAARNLAKTKFNRDDQASELIAVFESVIQSVNADGGL